MRRVALAALIAVGLLLGLGAAPAQAAPTALSMYTGYGYAGNLNDQVVGSGCVGGNDLGVFSNAVSSLYNRHGITLRLYDAANCTGSYTTISSGQRVPDLRTWGWDNRISSVRRN